MRSDVLGVDEAERRSVGDSGSRAQLKECQTNGHQSCAAKVRAAARSHRQPRQRM